MNYGEGGLSASDVALINGRNSDTFGDGNGIWVLLFLIVLLGGWGNRGFGGFGGNSGSTSVYEGYVLNNDFSQLSKQISDTYNLTDRKFDALTNGLCTLGYDNLVQANSVNANINSLGANLQNCCCDLRAQIAENKYATAQGFCNTNNSMLLNTRDIIDNQNMNFRAIIDTLNANKLEAKNDKIAEQQNEINALRLSASQSAQNEYLLNSLRNGCPVNAQLVCGNTPIPVNYVSAGCNCNSGCGC